VKCFIDYAFAPVVSSRLHLLQPNPPVVLSKSKRLLTYLLGFPWSYGIFQEYYSSSPEFAGSSGIPAIGTSAMGILYMIAPLTFGLFTRWPQYRRKAMVAGVFTMCLSLGLSSLCTTVPQLIVTQGIFYGVGGAIVYCPCIILLDEWFVRRKGLAFGIMWAGTALGGVVIPLLLQFLLSRYGFRNTLRIWAGLLFAVLLPVTIFIKPRLPVSATTRCGITFTFLTNKTFWVLQSGNILQGLGFFVPSICKCLYKRPSRSTLTLCSNM